MGQPHSRLRQLGQKALRECGWLVIPYPAGYATGAGVSDTLVCARGRFIAVEWKTEKDNITSGAGRDRFIRQLRFLKSVRDAGGGAVIAYTPEEAVEAIRRVLAEEEKRP